MTDLNNQPLNEDSFTLENEIDISEVLKVLFKEKIIIFITSAVVALSSIFYALSLTNYYKSEALMSVRDGGSANTPQFSSAASMLGITIATANDKSMEIIELIKSRKFLKRLLEFEKVLPSIMAAESYDLESKKLSFDSDVYIANTNTWKDKKGMKSLTPPSYLEAHAIYLNELLTITFDRQTGLIVMDIVHISPIFAKEFLDLIINEVNNILRKKDLEESEQALDYLKLQLGSTSLVAIQRSINYLIEDHLKVRTMANMYEDYLFVVIDPPYIPEKIINNSKRSIVIFSTIFGALLGSFFVLFRYYSKKNL